SFYWEPQPTASGEPFDPEALTAAHLSWAFDTRVRVTNPATGQSVVVRINDRGPYVDGRCLDLSRGAFREIADLDAGVITATYEVLAD
ncbi:MAG: septal ring lytic transglycosylase RlpA family protein, partial [Natronosporangium sp.]